MEQPELLVGVGCGHLLARQHVLSHEDILAGLAQVCVLVDHPQLLGAHLGAGIHDIECFVGHVVFG